MPEKIRIGVVGCGLIGKRRAAEAAAATSSRLTVVADTNRRSAEEIAARYGCRFVTAWEELVDAPDVDAVVISTPNRWLAEIGVAALEARKHVLLEKPMGRNLKEALGIAAAAKGAGRVLKVGFNHRYHPAIERAHSLLVNGTIGELINLRVRYGHGGRPGYEQEWRCDPDIAGGGELIDQGVHALDLVHWFAGTPRLVAAMTQDAVWPIAPLEDNGFALLRCAHDVVASLHTSWTQWQNLFSFEVFATKGALLVDGLGGSYGSETLRVNERSPTGGAPSVREQRFEGPDRSWALEWTQFLSAIRDGAPYYGNPEDGIAVMATLDALYHSAKQCSFVTIETPAASR